MRSIRVIERYDAARLHPPALDDFSRFKEKVIMMNAFQMLLEQLDKQTLASIIRQQGLSIKPKVLRQAMEEIITQTIKRVAP
jgi:hypothetical protein